MFCDIAFLLHFRLKRTRKFEDFEYSAVERNSPHVLCLIRFADNSCLRPESLFKIQYQRVDLCGLRYKPSVHLLESGDNFT